MAAENSASYFFSKHSYNVNVGKFFSNRVGQPAQSGAGAAGIEATNPPNLLAQKTPVDHELLPAKIEVGRKAVPYAPTSLDEILNLEQCASWLQQPASTLRRMIQDGRLKPLPFPGDDYRLHARTVLIQMGVMRDALDSSANFTEAKPDHPTQVAKRASLTNQREIHGPATGLQSEEPLAKEDDVCELCRSVKLTHLCSDKLTHSGRSEGVFSFQGVGQSR